MARLNANTEQFILPTLCKIANLFVEKFPDDCAIINDVFQQIEK
jgi:hypothetical protein